MHVILGLLGSIVTILYLLDRLNIDIGWLNPWSWRRRRAWAKKYEGDPIYSVEDPMDVAAILIVGAARLEGDLSAEQKQSVVEQFEENFSMDAKSAAALLGSAAHLLGAPQVVGTQLKGVASKNKGTFSPEQATSLIAMMEHVASVGGELSEAQRDYLQEMKAEFLPPEQQGTWA